MKVEIGQYHLEYSEVIIQIANEPIKIRLPDELENDFFFHINFVDDSNSKAFTTLRTPIDSNNTRIDFINFGAALNAGNTELLALGTLRRIPLYLSYRIFDLPGNGKTLLVNFYTKTK